MGVDLLAQKIVIKGRAGILTGVPGVEDKLRGYGYADIIGVDEAGRGPLAGPVVAAAVILPKGFELHGIDDSKKLNALNREKAFDRIVSSRAAYAVGIVDNEMIDRINILRASMRAMTQAVAKLTCRSPFVLIDGHLPVPNLDYPQLAVIGGDGCCPSIAAASIIAKVTRDRIMDHYANLYPDFSFSRHKGYATPEHMKELKLHGPTPIHRQSYKPVHAIVHEPELALAE